MPAVSVIIPAYNCSAFLPATLDSALAQTYHDLEIIVVDDGSTDDTPARLGPYFSRITYIRQTNKGVSAARNAGIRAARGEFLAFLDADDVWVPEKLALQVPLLADPAVGIVYSDFSVHYADGTALASYLAGRPLAQEGWIAENYIQSRFFLPSCMVVRRSAVEECGLFDEDLRASEDFELFARVCLRWQARRVDQPLTRRREEGHNLTADKAKLSRYTILALEKILLREPDLQPRTKRAVFEELGRHHWWRGYELFQSAEPGAARPHLARAIRYNRENLRTCAPLLLASFLPRNVLTQIRQRRQKS